MEELGDLLFGHELGEAFVLLGGADGEHGVVGGEAAFVDELEEAAEGGELAGHGGLGVVVFAHELEVVADVVGVGVEEEVVGVGRGHVDGGEGFDDDGGGGGGAVEGGEGRGVEIVGHDFGGDAEEELAELTEVGAVTAAGVGGEVAFKLEVVEELLDACGMLWVIHKKSLLARGRCCRDSIATATVPAPLES